MPSPINDQCDEPEEVEWIPNPFDQWRKWQAILDDFCDSTNQPRQFLDLHS